MSTILKFIKSMFVLFLICGLLFSSGVFSLLLYARISGKTFLAEASQTSVVLAEGSEDAPAQEEEPPAPPPLPASAMLDAPIIRQMPELPAGCEIVSLTMLLNFYGIGKSKMELVDEMVKDPTPIRWSSGKIAYWGHPNTGYVGDVTGKSRGFGIYSAALLETLKANIPTAVDLTGGPFEAIERQIADGFPVIVWTTIDFNVPQKWVEWDTPIGPIRTTFMEHAVLMVGYDEQNVYVNDPWSGKKALPIAKEQFKETWDVMGKQALSYTKAS